MAEWEGMDRALMGLYDNKFKVKIDLYQISGVGRQNKYQQKYFQYQSWTLEQISIKFLISFNSYSTLKIRIQMLS